MHVLVAISAFIWLASCPLFSFAQVVFIGRQSPSSLHLA